MKIVTATAATATTVATTTTTAATTTALAGLGFVDGESPAVMFLFVHGTDRSLSSVVCLHFNKTKALAAARITVLNDLCTDDCAKFREQLLQHLVGHTVSKISDVKFLSH